ncbi:GSCOCG00008334001-RA-CDS [Cotesia congregata]|nr:GSCOCG00008334001-RA-CDS [Cotesia congregata]
MLERNLLHFACRHHVFEIILKIVFKVSWPVTRGLEVLIFKRFQKEWRLIDKSNYKIGLQDARVVEVLGERVEEIKQYILDQLQIFHPRDDNQELLELAYIFLGGTPPKGIKFKLPEPCIMRDGMQKPSTFLKYSCSKINFCYQEKILLVFVKSPFL